MCCDKIRSTAPAITTNEPEVLKKVLTGDELWLYGCDLEIKAQSSQWKSSGPPYPKRAWQSHSKIKTMLLCFLIRKVVSLEYAPLGQSIGKDCYLNGPHWLSDAI